MLLKSIKIDSYIKLVLIVDNTWSRNIGRLKTLIRAQIFVVEQWRKMVKDCTPLRMPLTAQNDAR